jgi:hypothetical protein
MLDTSIVMHKLSYTPMLTSRILFLFLVVSWEVRIGSTRHELSFSQSVPKPAGQVPPHLGYVPEATTCTPLITLQHFSTTRIFTMHSALFKSHCLTEMTSIVLDSQKPTKRPFRSNI